MISSLLAKITAYFLKRNKKDLNDQEYFTKLKMFLSKPKLISLNNYLHFPGLLPHYQLSLLFDSS